jgi:DNA modification methylase
MPKRNKLNETPDSKSINSELKIQYVDISLLKKYSKNAKIHTKKQIAKLIQSMKAFGVVTPILVNKLYEIIAGHARFQSLLELGYTTVPIIMLEHLTEAQVKAYRLADNRIAEEAEYNDELLKIELNELLKFEDIVITDTGFDIAEVDNIVIEDYKEKKEKPDKADELVDLSEIEDRVKLGDIWKLGYHLLLCGDSLKAESYPALMGDDKASLVLTDMPYNLPASFIGGKGKIKHENFQMAAGELSDLEFENFISTFINHLKNFSTENAYLMLFIDWRGINTVLNAGRKNDLRLKNIICWHKLAGNMGNPWRSAHELIPIFLKQGAKQCRDNVELGKHGRFRTNVWEHKGVSATNPKSLELLKLHGTPKPIGLLHGAILDVSCPNDIVLDNFSGIGSTLLACECAKRRARVIEIEPKYCNATLHRFEKITGKKAEFVRNIGDSNNDR